MPTYLYTCQNSNPEQEFEAEHSIKIVLEECPICKEKGLPSHAPKRLISGGSGKGIVELTGKELINKTREEAQKYKKEMYNSEKLYSNALGESKYQSIQQSLDRNKR